MMDETSSSKKPEERGLSAVHYGVVSILCALISLFVFPMIFAIATITISVGGLRLIKSAPKPKLALALNLVGLVLGVLLLFCFLAVTYYKRNGS